MSSKKSTPNKTSTPATKPPGQQARWQERVQNSDSTTQDDPGKIAFQLLSLEILQKFLSEGEIAYENIKTNDAPYLETPTIHWQPDSLFLQKLEEEGLNDPDLLRIVMNTLTSNIHDILYCDYSGKTDKDFEIIFSNLNSDDGQVKFSLYFPKALDPREVLQKLQDPKVAKSLEATIKTELHKTKACAEIFESFGNPGQGYGRA
jgi:hypothetical protein